MGFDPGFERPTCLATLKRNSLSVDDYVCVRTSLVEYRRLFHFLNLQVKTLKSSWYFSYVRVKMEKNVSYINPSTFEQVIFEHRVRLPKKTSEMVENVLADIRFFIRHLDPDIKRIASRLERLKILKKKQYVVFN